MSDPVEEFRKEQLARLDKAAFHDFLRDLTAVEINDESGVAVLKTDQASMEMTRRGTGDDSPEGVVVWYATEAAQVSDTLLRTLAKQVPK